MWEKINRYYPPWLDILPLILFAMVFNYINSHYNLLPDRIPTHFGVSGEPDAWSSKSIWSVYGILIIGFAVYISMALINIFLLISPDDPKKVINISEREKEKLGPMRLEEIRAFSVKNLLVLNLLIAIMTTYMAYEATNTALGLSKGLGNIMWGFFAAIMIASLYFTVKVLLMTSTSGARNQKRGN